MDIEWIEKLTQRMRASGIGSLACSMDGSSIRIVLPPASSSQGTGLGNPANWQASQNKATITVQAPAFGRFHPAHPMARELGAAIGRSVDFDEPLGYLEVCGVMTALPATAPCTVQAIHANAGDWVQYGQALVEIQPA